MIQTLTESMRSLLNRIDETAPTPLTFSIESRGWHHGQSDLTLVAKRAGQYVGHIDFVDYHGEISIQMIEVPEYFQKQGIGTQMVLALQARYPDAEIGWGGTTPEGSRLYASLPKTEVEVPEIREKMDRLAALKAEQAECEQAVEDFKAQHPGTWTDAIRAAFHQVVDYDEWHERTDEIERLEHELWDTKPTKTLIQTMRESLTEADQPLDPKRAEILRVYSTLPSYTPGKGHRMTPESYLKHFLLKMPDSDLDDALEYFRKEAAEAGQHPVAAEPAEPARADAETATLRRLLAKKPRGFAKWLGELYSDPGELAEVKKDPEALLDAFAEWLRDELSLTVREDGLIQPSWRVEREGRRLLDSETVVLYHHTSTGALKKIRKEGLHTRHGRMANPHQNSFAGVYLTVEWDGHAVTNYMGNACSASGGTPVTLLVAVPWDHLRRDPDDADIATGALQYVVSDVQPGQILEVEKR